MPLKLFTKEDISRICPHCRKELGTMLKCRYCNKLLDDDVDKLKESSQDRIYGGIFCYVFSADKSKIAFVTGNAGSKNPAIYLYDIKLCKIIWANIKHCAACKMFYLEDRIIIISRSGGVSSLESFNADDGQSVLKIDKEETWTNMFQFKNDFLIGFRDGFLYRYNKYLEIVNSICLKEDPKSKEASYYCNPAPFNIVADRTENHIAFSHESKLFLVDSDFNIIWEKDVGGDFFEFRGNPSFGRGSTYPQQKYTWAFNLLEINPESDLKQVKVAFRNKAMQWHPDRHLEENKDLAEGKFKEIVRAYELLIENDEDVVKEELHDMGFSRKLFFSNLGYSRILGINFWQQEETSKVFIEVKVNQGTDKFFDLEGKIISNKAEIGFIKTKRVRHAKESYDLVNTQRELKWSLREGGFWFRPMGGKLYQDIQDGYFLRYDQKKAEEFLNNLDLKIDFWNTFISEKINEIKKSDEFNNLKSVVYERDKNRCAACGNKRNTYFHNIFSLSEHIAKYISENCLNISNLEIKEVQSFYDLKNNLILCPKCYTEEYGESQIEYHLNCIGENNSWSPIIGENFPKSEDILDKAYKKMRICTKSNPRILFSTYLSKIEEFEKEAAFSRRGRQILGDRQTIKIQLLFRLGEYDLAKRWAMRHGRFLRKVCDEIYPEYLGCEKDSFTANNWEKIVSKVIDRIIDSYKKDDYKIRYDWGYPKFGLKKYRKLFRDVEEEIKEEAGASNG